MSSFIDWHFCHEIQLSPREMADYLDLLAVFRSKSNDCPTMEKALALLDAISLQQQVYALPLLVDIALQQMPGKYASQYRYTEIQTA